MSFDFANPWALVLLGLIPLYLWLARGSRRSAIVHSRTGVLAAIGRGSTRFVALAPDALRIGAIAALIVALAAPRTGVSVVDVESEGISIMLVVDISSSMLAEDFHPQNRLAVAKQKVADFVRGRENDRIGMVAFAGEALTLVPITIDYGVLFRAIDQLDIGLVEDGTAIGTAIATGANRLRRAPGESMVMILMTDGENNRGEVDPVTAARAAAAFGIRIYTVGIGTHGVAPMPISRGPFGGYQYANVPVRIDEELLTEIASLSGGQYFRATNEAALDSIYARIDELEKSTVEMRRWIEHTPRHLPFLLFGSMLLVAEWLLLASRYGRLP